MQNQANILPVPIKPDQEPDKVNILVVDDLPDKRAVYHTILDELGQNLIIAKSGEEALMLVLKHDFAVILLDVNMPTMDGFETASLIRQRKKSARTPIIFLTAFIDEVRTAQGYASGAVDYLPTPVVPEVLRAKVRVFIELSQMRQQAASQAEERARRTSAEEADRRKDEFLGMLAHELRNPLGPIRNAAHLLKMMGIADPRVDQLRDIIDRQVTHMARLIDDLLDSTRLARGQILLRDERCDLGRVVYQTAEDYRSIFDASGIILKVEVPDSPIWVDGDPTRLVQSIGNLLHNAHKFTDPAGTVSVRLTSDPEKQIATIEVRDTGIGLDADILPYIFDVFRQAHQGLDRNRGGLGLGLTLVKGLIELHDGTIQVTSDGPGKGTLFTIQLPTRAGVSAVEDPQANLLQIHKGGKKRILIIEDSRDTAESISMLLSMDGYEAKIAQSGLEGLELARIFLPHVVLCDIGLPGMDGYQIARTMRDDPTLSLMHIIALTGYGRDEDQRQAREAGFDLHLTKPIDYNGLRRALTHLPEKRKPQASTGV